MKLKALPLFLLSSRQCVFIATAMLLTGNACLAQPKSENSNKKVYEESEEEVVDSDQETAPPIGIRIGDFFYRDVRASEGVKLRLSFTLFAEVEKENEEQFLRIYDKTLKRIRDQVIIAIRLSETSDFQEPSLSRLKRRIKIRLHRVLPQLEIEDLMLRDFIYFTDTD